jgi:hypothetical protein
MLYYVKTGDLTRLLRSSFNGLYHPSYEVKHLTVAIEDEKRKILNQTAHSHSGNLYDFFNENRRLPSFELIGKIHQLLMSKLAKEEKVDISNISHFWLKHYQRKDYTVLNVEAGLKVFERLGYITTIVSLKVINAIQNASEKGVRHLLTEYISNHSSSIINTVLENLDPDSLHSNIRWLKLPSDHISSLPDNLFIDKLDELLWYNRRSESIRLDEIENVLGSTKYLTLKERLGVMGYSIKVPHHCSKARWLTHKGFLIIEEEPSSDDVYTNDRSSLNRYNNGILDSQDVDFIRERGLKCFELAGFHNGWFSVLADLDLFKIYPRSEIRDNIQHILYNAILADMQSINDFSNLFYFVGNLPQLAYEYELEIDLDILFKSFTNYITSQVNVKFF